MTSIEELAAGLMALSGELSCLAARGCHMAPEGLAVLAAYVEALAKEADDLSDPEPAPVAIGGNVVAFPAIGRPRPRRPGSGGDAA